MTARKSTTSHRLLRRAGGVRTSDSLDFIGEEPLSIRIHDKPYSVVMRTPGDEMFHAAGFCLGEGLVDAPGDIEIIGYDELLDPNVVDIWLTDERRQNAKTARTPLGACGFRVGGGIPIRARRCRRHRCAGSRRG